MNKISFTPKLMTSKKAHGRWGDLISCALPVFWCFNILVNSNFLLKLNEWQTENPLFTLRIRGKQWYWVYKLDTAWKNRICALNYEIGTKKDVLIKSVARSSDTKIAVADINFQKFHQQLKNSYLDTTAIGSQSFRGTDIYTANHLPLSSNKNLGSSTTRKCPSEAALLTQNTTTAHKYFLESLLLLAKNLVSTQQTGKRTKYYEHLTLPYEMLSVGVTRASTIKATIYNTEFLQPYKRFWLTLKQKSIKTSTGSLLKLNEQCLINTNLSKLSQQVQKLSWKNSNRLLKTDNILYLPVNHRVTVVTNSFDVVHSWFVPGLGIKMDCVPGRSTHHSMKFHQIGFYFGQCAEICGRFHHHMPINIVLLNMDLFIFWWNKKNTWEIN